MLTVALFAGIPPDPLAALRGPVVRDARYRAVFEAGEAWWAGRVPGGGPLSIAVDDLRSRDVAATLHGCAAFEALLAGGGRCDAIAEHSLGLYPALHAAGALDLDATLALALHAAELIAQAAAARPGGLVAVVGYPADALEALARDAAREAGDGAVCAVAAWNSAHQAVLGGDLGALEAAERLARSRGALEVRRLPHRAALHTPLLAEAARRLGERAAALPVREPRVPVFAHTHASPLTTVAAIREALAAQLAAPVRFSSVIERLRREGARCYVDCGPGDVLGRLVRWIDRDAEVTALDGRDERGLERALRLAGAHEQERAAEVEWTSR